MGRLGVGFQDVAAAADALLYSGERPTNDRVRGLLGRGSPNTIGPLLDRWWATLGPRLRQQHTKMDMPDAPEEVAALATQFWTQALATARQLAEDSLTAERAALEEAHHALDATREALQADAAAALEATKAAAHAQSLAETRLLDAQRLNEQQALQLADLAQQRDTLQTRCDRQEAEVIGLSGRLRQQEIDAMAQQSSHTQHMLDIENRANTEIDRARQETKALRSQMATLSRERSASLQSLQRLQEEAMATSVAAQREAELQRGRAEALEQQLARLGDLPAALKVMLAQVPKQTKRPTKRKAKAI